MTESSLSLRIVFQQFLWRSAFISSKMEQSLQKVRKQNCLNNAPLLENTIRISKQKYYQRVSLDEVLNLTQKE